MWASYASSSTPLYSQYGTVSQAGKYSNAILAFEFRSEVCKQGNRFYRIGKRKSYVKANTQIVTGEPRASSQSEDGLSIVFCVKVWMRTSDIVSHVLPLIVNVVQTEELPKST